MRFAVISDVHGNALALDAVLADIAAHGVDATLCLGDSVSGPVDPAGALERIMGLSGPFVAGNHDRWVGGQARADMWSADSYAIANLSPDQLAWVAALPKTAVFADTVFLCHGTPLDDEAAWLDNFYDGRSTTLPDEADVSRLAEGLNYPVLLCGHTHIARSVRLRDGRLIVNPGSVGMQLLRGTPDAHYAIVEHRAGQWSTSLRAVPYDYEAAARQAAANGFPQWAESIRHGWAGPESLD